MTNTLIFVTAICVAVFMAIHPTQANSNCTNFFGNPIGSGYSDYPSARSVARRKFGHSVIGIAFGPSCSNRSGG